MYEVTGCKERLVERQDWESDLLHRGREAVCAAGGDSGKEAEGGDGGSASEAAGADDAVPAGAGELFVFAEACGGRHLAERGEGGAQQGA